jgi:hypothetical protein
MRLLLLSITMLSCWAAEAEIKLPADVQAAIDKSEAAVSTAQAKADAEIFKIKSALIKDLTKAQESATKKGDLKLALAIKDQIDGIKLPELIDTRRIDPAKFKSYNAKAWDTFPGTLVTVNAEAAATVATLEKTQEAILLPHPGDLWASHDQGKKSDYHGLATQHRGLPHMVMLVKVGDADAQVIETGRSYVGPGTIVVSANDDNPSNNVGGVRMKIIIQSKP